MALSNWDTLTWNKDGMCVEGALALPDGTMVEVYKNWLYVHDTHAHRGKGDRFEGDIVLSFKKGECQYRHLHLLGKRGPQESIFFVAIYRTYTDPPTEAFKLFGIGAYGFNRSGKWTGITEDTISKLMVWLKRMDEEYAIGLPEFMERLRFNQGDAFFAREFGEALPASEPGKAQPPFLMQALDKLKP